MDEEFRLEKLRIHDRLTNVENGIVDNGKKVDALTEAIVGKVNNGNAGLKTRIDRVETGVKIICFLIGSGSLLWCITLFASKVNM